MVESNLDFVISSGTALSRSCFEDNTFSCTDCLIFGEYAKSDKKASLKNEAFKRKIKKTKVLSFFLNNPA